MLDVAGCRTDLTREEDGGVKSILVIFVCCRLTTPYQIGEVPFPSQPDLSYGI